MIQLDASVLEEAAIRSLLTLDQVSLDKPSEVKQAGHLAFWLKKLKPLQIIDLKELKAAVDALAGRGLVSGRIDKAQDIPPPRTRFVNETFAILAAVGIARSCGYRICLSAPDFHDLSTSLRYHSFSPSALIAILAAHCQRLAPAP